MHTYIHTLDDENGFPIVIASGGRKDHTYEIHSTTEVYDITKNKWYIYIYT